MQLLIPFNRTNISKIDRGYLSRALISGHSSGNGTFAKQVKESVASSLGGLRTLLTRSCRHALDMSAPLAYLKPGDEVIVPSYAFVSTASTFGLFGARPVFVDSRADTLNIYESSFAS